MSHEEDAFYQSILDSPDDDAPRLVFADWLEDHGQPERAAFVRAQVRLAAIDEDDPARPDLLRDEAAYLPTAMAALRARERVGWLAAVPRWATKYLSYDRGFPGRLVATARHFVAHGEALAAAVPVQHLRLGGLRQAREAVAACPALRRMRSLSVRDENVTTHAVPLLAASPHAAGLTRLEMPRCWLRAEAVAALAASPHLAGLRHLDLEGNGGIEDEGAAALASSPHLRSLRTLDLGQCRVGVRGVRELAGSQALAGLRQLSLSSALSVHTLATSHRLAALERLDLSWAVDWPAAARELLRPPGLPALRRLCLGGRRWTADLWGVEPAARLRGGLSLRLTQPGGPAGAVTDSPLLAACRELELYGGGADTCQGLVRSAAVGGLVKLWLYRCPLTTEDVAALATSPHFLSLRELSLGANPLTEASVAALLAAPFAGRLTRLDLSHVQFEEGCWRLLARTDALSSLHELRLSEVELRQWPALHEELKRRFGARISYC
jgi:uncharacterized protein (TIGR02996 family)